MLSGCRLLAQLVVVQCCRGAVRCFLGACCRQQCIALLSGCSAMLSGCSCWHSWLWCSGYAVGVQDYCNTLPVQSRALCDFCFAAVNPQFLLLLLRVRPSTKKAFDGDLDTSWTSAVADSVRNHTASHAASQVRLNQRPVATLRRPLFAHAKAVPGPVVLGSCGVAALGVPS